MTLPSELLDVLACPQCKSDLTLSGDEKGLICESCKVSYPIRDGIPALLIEEGRPCGAGAPPPSTPERGAEPSPPVPAGERVRFAVVEGKNNGLLIEVQKGTCRALGRSLDETERTRVFSVESTVSLDDNSKKLVMNYVAKQFQKAGGSRPVQSTGGEGNLGGFRRAADVPISDGAVSRLHAMLFFGEGTVGILDLVSKNGTFVNGVEVESKILKKGDLITVGGTKIRFEGS